MPRMHRCYNYASRSRLSSASTSRTRHVILHSKDDEVVSCTVSDEPLCNRNLLHQALIESRSAQRLADEEAASLHCDD